MVERTSGMALHRYWKKRNFAHTSEPHGTLATSVQASPRLFVVQKHAASRLHYDFRLELDGTLKSWAIPKGPSLNPADKRLAVHVEDHPIEYAEFEGIIPPKQYGAGTVMVWDRGVWTPDGDAKSAYAKGHMKFTLEGEKLHGRWTLVRMGGRQKRVENNWLLIKERDDTARASTSNITALQPNSVKSGRNMDAITQGKSDVWHSNRSSDTTRVRPNVSGADNPRPRAKSVGNSSSPHRNIARNKVPLMEWIRPQLATLVDRVPQGEEWIHELKYDGYRMLCRIQEGRARLFSRNGHEWTAKLREQATAAAQLPVKEAWLDGEIVVVKPDGTMSFQALQNAFDGRLEGRLVYYLFDLLYLDGFDLRHTAQRERKQLLSKLFVGEEKDGTLRYSDHIHGQGQVVFDDACRRGLEGLIAKHVDAGYVAGRNRNWVKLKCQRRQEFVIGGFTDPSGSRQGFGALLLGVFEQKHHLQYVGRVGTGFSSARLGELYRMLNRLEQTRSPFMNPPSGWEAKRVHWVKPELVAEVRFAEWTQEGLLRQAAFLGLRNDKPPGAIVREKATHMPKRSHHAPRVSGPSSTDARPVSRRSSSIVAGITLSHPDRILYDEEGITKLELAQYYEQIAEWILPHLRDRPLTLVRCPEGHEQKCFYQKHVTDHVHEAVERVEVQEDHGSACYMIVNTTAALVSLVQLGVLEFHTWGATRKRLDRPDRMVLDLDPDPNLSWPDIVEAAHLVKTVLEALDLACFLKTTGGKGLHIVVPLERRHTWNQVKDFSKGVAHHLATTVPTRFTDNLAKRARGGKIFIDYLRNGRGATAVAAYSTRATAGAPISVPLTWDELSHTPRSDYFTLRNIQHRMASLHKDPWAEYGRIRQHVTARLIKQMGIAD